MKDEDILNDSEIAVVHGNSDFGSMEQRQVVNQTVLKCAVGLYCSKASLNILKLHGLTTDDYNLTPKGKSYLWAVYSGEDF